MDDLDDDDRKRNRLWASQFREVGVLWAALGPLEVIVAFIVTGKADDLPLSIVFAVLTFCLGWIVVFFAIEGVNSP